MDRMAPVLAALPEGDRVAAAQDVGDAGGADLREPVQVGVDQPEPVMRDLVGEGDDAGEDRSRLAGAPGRIPAGRLALETLVHIRRTVTGTAHRDVRDTATAADNAADAALVPGPGEDSRSPAAARQRIGPDVAGDVHVRGQVV